MFWLIFNHVLICCMNIMHPFDYWHDFLAFHNPSVGPGTATHILKCLEKMIWILVYRRWQKAKYLRSSTPVLICLRYGGYCCHHNKIIITLIKFVIKLCNKSWFENTSKTEILIYRKNHSSCSCLQYDSGSYSLYVMPVIFFKEKDVLTLPAFC